MSRQLRTPEDAAARKAGIIRPQAASSDSSGLLGPIASATLGNVLSELRKLSGKCVEATQPEDDDVDEHCLGWDDDEDWDDDLGCLADSDGEVMYGFVKRDSPRQTSCGNLYDLSNKPELLVGPDTILIGTHKKLSTDAAIEMLRAIVDDGLPTYKTRMQREKYYNAYDVYVSSEAEFKLDLDSLKAAVAAEGQARINADAGCCELWRVRHELCKEDPRYYLVTDKTDCNIRILKFNEDRPARLAKSAKKKGEPKETIICWRHVTPLCEAIRRVVSKELGIPLPIEHSVKERVEYCISYLAALKKLGVTGKKLEGRINKQFKGEDSKDLRMPVKNSVTFAKNANACSVTAKHYKLKLIPLLEKLCYG